MPTIPQMFVNMFLDLTKIQQDEAFNAIVKARALKASFNKSTCSLPVSKVHEIVAANPNLSRSQLYALCRDAGVCHNTVQTQLSSLVKEHA